MEVLRSGQGLVPAQSHLRASPCPLFPNAFWRIRSTLLTELGNQGGESPWPSSGLGQKVCRKALCAVQAVAVWDKPAFGRPGLPAAVCCHAWVRPCMSRRFLCQALGYLVGKISEIPTPAARVGDSTWGSFLRAWEHTTPVMSPDETLAQVLTPRAELDLLRWRKISFKEAKQFMFTFLPLYLQLKPSPAVAVALFRLLHSFLSPTPLLLWCC